MSKVKVELFMDDERNLFVRKNDGTEYRVNVFEGGGYYTALWLQTEKEMEKVANARKAADEKWSAELAEREEARKVTGLAKLIMFIQRQKH